MYTHQLILNSHTVLHLYNKQTIVKCAFTGTNGSLITPAAQDCSVTTTDVETEHGRMAFQCTNTTCPLDHGKKVWRLSLGYDVAITGIKFQQPRMYCVILTYNT